MYIKKSYINILVLIFSISLYIVFGGQGCSQGFTTSTQQSSVSPVIQALQPNLDDEENDPNKPSFSLVYGKQVLDHYNSCLGYGAVSSRTSARWEEKKGTISENGKVKSLTAPMLVAATSIAGEVCKDLVDIEKQTPRLMLGVNFLSQDLPTSNSIKTAIRRLSRSCWARDEDPLEAQLIEDSLYQNFGTTSEASKAEKSMLYLCTAMLSSLDTITR